MIRILKGLLYSSVVVACVLLAVIYPLGQGWLGQDELDRASVAESMPAIKVEQRQQQIESAAIAVGLSAPKQILFGDLHVHTTFSADAYSFSLPLLHGEGTHPPADACDFARYCSALDFWSINDHAEGMPPQHWKRIVNGIRQCNAVTDVNDNPDTVAFLGWEWSQMGLTPETHYGHKNVVLRYTDDERIPSRPISSGGFASDTDLGKYGGWAGLGLAALLSSDQRGRDAVAYLQARSQTKPCAVGVPVRDLPNDCEEIAHTPVELFDKLDDWDHEALVIPHGTTWGNYTPRRSDWAKQLVGPMHSANWQNLFEVYSGHGNSEEYRHWRSLDVDKNGLLRCPPPTPDYEASCWRAGEIIRERCEEEGGIDCEARAALARKHHAEAGTAGILTVDGNDKAMWKDAGQCRDCFMPSFNYRPMGSAQYVMALTDFSDPQAMKRFDFGFIAASDNHSARPGTGYKELDRAHMSDMTAGINKNNLLGKLMAAGDSPTTAHSRPGPEEISGAERTELLIADRVGAYLYTGGLTAIHAPGRNRAAIWEAMKKREVYGTSGPRILLWFDAELDSGNAAAMGSELTASESPKFIVRAAGSFAQKPGCPELSHEALGPERLHKLCRNECYNPSDTRRQISRIEVVRIRPQVYPGEPVDGLIEDPWRTFECPTDTAGCKVSFRDTDFASAARDARYYVRAIEVSSPAVNGAGARCSLGEGGQCATADLCLPPYTSNEDDCLAPVEERAWSSPITVNFDDKR